jgi:3-hydroxyisobutyrate dehydrogenase-like beta-hydroxyacid dehydrogenase
MAYDRKREERREKREEEGANTTSQRGKDGVGDGDVIATTLVAADDDAEVVGPAPLT